METNFNFKSQICTDRIQSERLLALGLKKETADCTLFRRSKNAEWEISTDSYIDWVKEILPLELGYTHEDIIPAWSLHRLFQIYTNGVISSSWNMAKFNWDDLIDCIEDSIVKGYFNKEYLV